MPITASDDAQHGWVAGSRHAAPPRRAFFKVFYGIMDEGPFESDDAEFEWWDQLPSVPVVTSLLLRQPKPPEMEAKGARTHVCPSPQASGSPLRALEGMGLGAGDNRQR